LRVWRCDGLRRRFDRVDGFSAPGCLRGLGGERNSETQRGCAPQQQMMINHGRELEKLKRVSSRGEQLRNR
jgi:hypothetical protein